MTRGRWYLRKGAPKGRGRSTRGSKSAALVIGCAAMLLALVTLGCDSAMGTGRQALEQGDWRVALAAFEQVLSHDPESLEALSGAAVSLLALKRYDEALAHQEKLVQLDPSDAMTRVELGFNYLNHQGRPQDAVSMLQEAVQLEPSAKYLTFLGQAQQQAGDVDGAEASFRRAIEVDPSYSYARDQLGRLLEGRQRGEGG